MKKTRVGQIISRLLVQRDLCVAELARLVKLPQPTIHRIVKGVCEHPHISSLQPIADFFAITIEQLKGYEPIYSLDADTVIKVPLLDWHKVSCWLNAKNSIVVNNYVITDAKVGDNCFAVKIADDAMDPVFPRHTILIVDPTRAVKHLSFVIAQVTGCNRPVFRQLLHNNNKFYLKPLSPDISCYNIIILNNNDKILGPVIQAKRDWED
jgi:SOS-response transcriptional repressor LexA